MDYSLNRKKLLNLKYNLEIINKEISSLDESLYYLITDLDESFNINEKGICKDELDKSKVTLQNIKKEITTNIIPDINSKI